MIELSLSSYMLFYLLAVLLDSFESYFNFVANLACHIFFNFPVAGVLALESLSLPLLNGLVHRDRKRHNFVYFFDRL